MPQDARNKLRNMGGIMASYPELMQAATQRYQAGGPVMASPVVPRVDSVTVPGVGAPVVGLGRVPPMQPQMPTAGVGSFALPNETPGRRRAAAMPSPPTPPASSYLFDEPDFTVEDLLRGPGPTFLGATPSRGTVAAVSPEPSSAGASNRRARRPGPSYTEEDLVAVSPGRSGLGGREQGRGSALAEAKRLREQAASLGDQRGANNARTRLLAEAERLEESARVMSRDVDAMEGPEATGLGGQQLGPEETERLARENARTNLLPPEDRLTPELFAKVEEQLAKDVFPDAPTGGGNGAAGGGGGRGGTRGGGRGGLKKQVNEKIALFQELFGTDDKEVAQDRAMSLAMAGLAMAAGQSPDALTNIARGAMVGMQSFSEGESRRRQRDEQIKTLALESALAEQAAQQEYARDLNLELLKLGNVEQYRETPQVRTEGGFGDVEVYLPTPNAARQGVAPVLADPKRMDEIWTQSLSGRQDVYNTMDRARGLIETAEIGGFDGALARLQQDLKAATPNALKRVFGTENPTAPDNPTPQQQYDTLMKTLAARYTPIILGESGRTISDGDRQRVAEILGFAVDPASGRVGRYVGTSLTSEAELMSAIDEVEGILSSNYSEMDKIYSRYRPEQYQSTLERMQQADSPKRFVYDPETGELVEKGS